jgi:DNA-directed RNA polymerase specialized sigma subunit
MEKIDQIDLAIDWQLASHWPDTIYIYEDPEPYRTVIFDSKIKGLRPYQTIPLPKHIPKQDNTEDIFISALDAKYSRIYNRDYLMLDFLMLGYTQAEVGRMFGLSQQRVNKIRKKIRHGVVK